MNTQKKHKKKLERQREVQQKLLKQRMKKRREEKVETAKAQADREAQKVVNRHTATICYNKNGKMSEAEIKERLDKNMEILRALQEEYEAEQKLRQENQDKAPELQKHLQATPVRNWGGEASVEFNPNPPSTSETTTKSGPLDPTQALADVFPNETTTNA